MGCRPDKLCGGTLRVLGQTTATHKLGGWERRYLSVVAGTLAVVALFVVLHRLGVQHAAFCSF